MKITAKKKRNKKKIKTDAIQGKCNGQNVLLFIIEGFIYCCCFLTRFIPRRNNENIVGIPKLQKVTN